MFFHTNSELLSEPRL